MKQRLSCCVLLVLLALAANAAAQQGTTEIRGQVMDVQGAVLPGVTVTVRNQDTGMFRETVSNADGTYFISSLVPGRYLISAELQGFKKYSRPDVQLSIGKTSTVDLKLEVGGLEETVTVAAESPLVDVTSKEVGGNIVARELVELPSVNRNFIGFIALLPGIIPNISTESFGSDSVNANGQDARNNNYMLDGANNNDDVIGQRAGTQARTAIESIQEFQVITNQFDAEFGRTTGAVINAVTKQGTNQLKGSVFGFLQDAELTQRDYFTKQNNLTKPDTTNQQWGGTIGGPIVHDKMHYFASVERVAIDRANSINIPARPEFNAAPTTQDRVWNTMIRVDHQINRNNTWGVRWLREQSPQKNQIIPANTAAGPVGPVTQAASREESDIDQTIVGTLGSVLGNTRVNTLRFGFTRENVAFANPCFNGNGRHQDQCAPTLVFQTFTDQQSSVAQSRINNAYQLENTYSWFIPGKGGDHDVKLGAQYQYTTADSLTQDNLNGTFSFGRSDGPFNAADPRTYPDRFSIRVPGEQHNYQKVHFITGFAQDKWKMSHRLTLSLGLRYDLELVPIVEKDNPRFSDPNDYPVDRNNIQPRVGFSYDLFGNGRTVLRGGYGIFYDKTHLELISAVVTAGVFADSFTVTFPANNADPNPRIGLLPTDPFLVNGPQINRALLAQRFPAGARQKNTGNVNLDNPERVLPQTQEATVGFAHQLSGTTSFSADYIHSAARDQFMRIDLNPGLRDTTVATSTLRRIDPNFTAAVLMPVNVGRTDYDAVQMEVEKRFSHNFSGRVAYTLSHSRGNTPAVFIPTSGFQLLNDMRLDLNEGPTDIDRRHNFVVSGTALVPYTHGMTFSWVARALSGLPFTLTNGNVDPDRNGSQSEPLPAGSYSGNGTNAYSVDFESKRNGAYGPSFFQLDIRAGWRLNLAGRTFDVFGEVFNLTNRANFANPSGNQASSNFLILTALRAGAVPRTGQVGIRFAF